jgi:hypothetical protein
MQHSVVEKQSISQTYRENAGMRRDRTVMIWLFLFACLADLYV